MRHMHFFLSMVLVLLASVATAFASNGSVGIGNGRTQLANGLYSNHTAGALAVEHDVVRDKRSGEPLVSVQAIDRARCHKLIETMVEARIGNVRGYEHQPRPKSGETNYWIVFNRKGECYKLTPQPRAGSLLSVVLGTLAAP